MQFELSKGKYGKIIPYIQYLVMYEVQWRLKKKTFPEYFSESEAQGYLDNLKQILSRIDDSIIWNRSIFHTLISVMPLN